MTQVILDGIELINIPTIYFVNSQIDKTPVITTPVGSLTPKDVDRSILNDMSAFVGYTLFAESEDKRIGRFVGYWHQNKGSYVFGTDFIFLFKDEFSFYK